MATFSSDTPPTQITLEIRAQTQFPFSPAGYLPQKLVKEMSI